MTKNGILSNGWFKIIAALLAFAAGYGMLKADVKALKKEVAQNHTEGCIPAREVDKDMAAVLKEVIHLKEGQDRIEKRVTEIGQDVKDIKNSR